MNTAAVTEALTTNSSIPADGHANLSYEPTTNHITTAGFAYDAAGNQVRALIAGGASQRFQYDAANRLVNVKSDNNQIVIASYTYADSNERLNAEEGGSRTYYACDGSVEYTESGSSTTPQWSKSYIYLGVRLLSTLTPNGSGGEAIQYHHPDRFGYATGYKCARHNLLRTANAALRHCLERVAADWRKNQIAGSPPATAT